MKEQEIIRKLVEFLKTSDGENAKYIRELNLREGINRADLVSVKEDEIHCYEIKSASDNLNRLIKQACSYVKVFDRITIVLSEKHLKIAQKVLPSWWGLIVIEEDNSLFSMRSAEHNPVREVTAIAQVFTNDEAKVHLSQKFESNHLKSVSKSLYRSMLPQNFTLEELHNCLLDSLYSRAVPNFF